MEEDDQVPRGSKGGNKRIEVIKVKLVKVNI